MGELKLRSGRGLFWIQKQHTEFCLHLLQVHYWSPTRHPPPRYPCCTPASHRGRKKESEHKRGQPDWLEWVRRSQRFLYKMGLPFSWCPPVRLHLLQRPKASPEQPSVQAAAVSIIIAYTSESYLCLIEFVV